MMPATTNRRDLLGLAGLGAVTLAAPIAAAVAPWNAWDWLTAWHRLGCGVRLDSHGNLQLTPRPGVELEACGMLSELNTGSRLTELRAAVGEADTGCGALRAVERIEQIDREFVSEDDDPVGSAAWLERWSVAYDQLANIPASTGRGLAAKIRQGLEGNGSKASDLILHHALQQLERWA